MKNLSQIREVSVLAFNERVLQEAEDENNPLMERLRFLGIFSSNMDEFFKVRVAGVHRQIELGQKRMDAVLEAVAEESRDLDERFLAAYAAITERLAAAGIRILTESDIETNGTQLGPWLEGFFRQQVLPALVPIIVDDRHPFPQLVDGALYFGVKMLGHRPRYAILQIPSVVPRFIELPDGSIMYVDDVIRYCLNDVFYIFDYDRIEAFEFKISRDAELDMDNDFSEDYVRRMERELEQRKGGRPTRLVYDAAMPAGMLRMLMANLEISDEDTLIGGGRYHNMKDLMAFPSRRSDLVFPKREPASHPVLAQLRRPMVDAIREQDLLLTYPYQSFDHIIRMLREAAIDPKVRAIKMTLYRAAKGSQVVNALANAAHNGKQIVVSIELQARFDEAHNIELAERLSEAGALVLYGVPPMKTHGKLLLIERDDGRLAGLSTGNFNEATGRLYVDSALLTADPRLTDEVALVFDFLERAARMRMLHPPKFRHLLVSPFNTRRTILRLLERERKKGADGYVCLKVNHLTDPKVIRKIRAAAEAGVRMDLIVRTTYAMLPHPNIRAISILDRYLEHQRVYLFGRGEDRVVYMSSADLMERNLDWRVEVAFPVYAEPLKKQVADMMALQTTDTEKARILDADQSNRYVGGGAGQHRAQTETYEYFRGLAP